MGLRLVKDTKPVSPSVLLPVSPPRHTSSFAPCLTPCLTPCHPPVSLPVSPPVSLPVLLPVLLPVSLPVSPPVSLPVSPPHPCPYMVVGTLNCSIVVGTLNLGSETGGETGSETGGETGSETGGETGSETSHLVKLSLPDTSFLLCVSSFIAYRMAHFNKFGAQNRETAQWLIRIQNNGPKNHDVSAITVKYWLLQFLYWLWYFTKVLGWWIIPTMY